MVTERTKKRMRKVLIKKNDRLIKKGKDGREEIKCEKRRGNFKHYERRGRM